MSPKPSIAVRVIFNDAANEQHPTRETLSNTLEKAVGVKIVRSKVVEAFGNGMEIYGYTNDEVDAASRALILSNLSSNFPNANIKIGKLEESKGGLLAHPAYE